MAVKPRSAALAVEAQRRALTDSGAEVRASAQANALSIFDTDLSHSHCLSRADRIR
jgi:hypothetical protein